MSPLGKSRVWENQTPFSADGAPTLSPTPRHWKPPPSRSPVRAACAAAWQPSAAQPRGLQADAHTGAALTGLPTAALTGIPCRVSAANSMPRDPVRVPHTPRWWAGNRAGRVDCPPPPLPARAPAAHTPWARCRARPMRRHHPRGGPPAASRLAFLLLTEVCSCMR
jgi:hypothetical protein